MSSTRDFLATQVRVYKLIASGASATDKAKLLIYPSDAAENYSGSIDQTKFVTSSIGNDVWFFVSGAKKSKDNTSIKGVSVFGGDLYVSGVLYAEEGLSGSLQRLTNGLTYLVAGPGITINSQSNGQVVITGSTFSSGSTIGLGITDYATTGQTTHTEVGQIIFNSSDYSGSVHLRMALATTNVLASASAKLYNLTSGQYVEIGGSGITQLTTSNTTPQIKESVNLKTAANFDTTNTAIYELQIATENATYPVYVGGAEFRITSSVAEGGVTYSTTALFLSSSAYEDTALPRLEYDRESRIAIIPSMFSNQYGNWHEKQIRTTFQDGLQRVHSASVPTDYLYISSSINGLGGLDVSDIETQGEDWYYLYLIPSGSNNTTGSLSAIASKNNPTGSTTWGPTGYTNFRYIGPVYWNGTRFEPFYQVGSCEFIYNPQAIAGENNEPDSATFTVDVTTDNGKGGIKLPVTVKNFEGYYQLQTVNYTGTTTITTEQFFDLSTVIEQNKNSYVDDVAIFNPLKIHFPFEREARPREFDYKVSFVLGGSAYYNFNIYWNKFEDGYLDAGYVPPSSNTASIGLGSQESMYTATTTPSSQTAVICTYLLANNTAVDLDAWAIGLMTGSAFNRARYRRNLLAYRSGSSTATIEGSTVYATVPDLESSGSWDFNVRASGTNILFEVTGSATETIDWQLKLAKNEIN